MLGGGDYQETTTKLHGHHTVTISVFSYQIAIRARYQLEGVAASQLSYA